MVFPQQSQFGAGALIGEGIADIFGGIEQKRQQEQIQRTLEDPNVSPLQKALALKDNPKLAAEFLKQQRMSQLGQHLRGLQESFRTPGIAPPEVEASTQSIRAQPTQTRESESLFGDIPESALQETMALYPELQGAIKEELTGRREREKLVQKEKAEKRKEFVEERAFATQQVKPYFEKIEKIKDSIPKKTQALALARDAIESGDVGQFTRDHLANITGIQSLKTAKGAQLDLALKENLISNLSRVTGRAQNKWLEQVAIGAFPQIGRSQEANLTVQEALEADAALDRAESEIFDQISQEDIAKFGYIKPDIRSRVDKQFDPIAKEIMNRASYRTREIYERQNNPTTMVNKLVSKGTPLTREMFRALVNDTKDIQKAFEKARKLGYTIYSNEDVLKYEQ